MTLVDCGSAKVPDIESALTIMGCRVRTVLLSRANGHDPGRSQAVIISGGPHLFTDDDVGPALTAQLSFLDTLELPALGICLGHQGLGIRAGAKVYLGAERRCDESITVQGEHPLLQGLDARFTMRADHCEGISLPEGFVLLASSAHYEVEVMASTRRPHFGVQFHPEVSGEPGQILLRNFCRLAREPTANS